MTGEQMENIDELIAKYLSGNASPEEAMDLENWKNQSAENQNYFQQSKNAHALSNRNGLKPKNDKHTSWEKLNERLERTDSKLIPLYRKPFFMRVAATVIVLVGIGFLLQRFYSSAPVPSVQIASSSMVTTDTLPDGSSVVLNKNSELTFNQNGKDRKANLKGEAFFNVVHNDKVPFEVCIADVTIKDIGTAFNVKAIANTGVIEVAVESGEVSISSAKLSGIILKQGEKAVYTITSGQISKSTLQPLDNIATYKSKMFVFKGTSLTSVITQLSDVYNTRIELADSVLVNKSVNVTFQNESLDTIINILTEALNLKAEKRGDVIFIESMENN
jgi:transmembrane sensor